MRIIYDATEHKQDEERNEVEKILDQIPKNISSSNMYRNAVSEMNACPICGGRTTKVGFTCSRSEADSEMASRCLEYDYVYRLKAECEQCSSEWESEPFAYCATFNKSKLERTLKRDVDGAWGFGLLSAVIVAVLIALACTTNIAVDVLVGIFILGALPTAFVAIAFGTGAVTDSVWLKEEKRAMKEYNETYFVYGSCYSEEWEYESVTDGIEKFLKSEGYDPTY